MEPHKTLSINTQCHLGITIISKKISRRIINSPREPRKHLYRYFLMDGAKYASKNSPCPHCNKPDWCYAILDGNLSVCNREYPPSNGWYKTNKQDRNNKYYYAKTNSDLELNNDKPLLINIQTWHYNDRQGHPLVKVIRQNFTDGKKKIHQESWSGKTWIKSLKHIKRENIPIYRYSEIKKAIQEKKIIFFVEGEKCVDALLGLGLEATCNLRGSDGLSDSDLNDLVGANLIICPDRDLPGLKLADRVSKRFPDADFLYAYPDSHFWDDCPESGGADVADWIVDFKLSTKNILDAIEPKRELTWSQDVSLQELKIMGFDRDQQKQIEQAVDGLIEQNLSESQKLIFLSQLASIYKWDDSKLKSYYLIRLKELEFGETKEETQQEINEVLNNLNNDLPISAFLDGELSNILTKFSNDLQYKQISVLSIVLSAISALHKVGTEVRLKRGFEISPNLYSLLVMPTGQGKSPLLKNVVTKPFSQIESKLFEGYQLAVNAYNEEKAQFAVMTRDEQKKYLEENGTFDEPSNSPQILYTTDCNATAIAQQFSRYPFRGFIGIYDEASKLFNFKAGGRGDDHSTLLSLYDGSGIKELRTSEGVRANINKTLFSIIGLIQPKILLDLMGEGDDIQGAWARFIYCEQDKEKRIYNLFEDSDDFTEIHNSLAQIYNLVLALPQHIYTLTSEAKKILQDYLNNGCEEERMRTSHLGLEAFLGKAGSRIPKLALNLHVLQNIEKNFSTVIEGNTIYQAIFLDEYYYNQIKSFYSKARAKKGELAPKLVEILRIARYKSTSVTARDIVRLSWVFKKDKDSTEQVRQYFQQLQELGYGECSGYGNRMKFTAK
jgi:5S rRNA maturation endonuclease (ribonuclease M5)